MLGLLALAVALGPMVVGWAPDAMETENVLAPPSGA